MYFGDYDVFLGFKGLNWVPTKDVRSAEVISLNVTMMVGEGCAVLFRVQRRVTCDSHQRSGGGRHHVTVAVKKCKYSSLFF